MKIVAYMIVASLMIATPSAFAATHSASAEADSCPGLVGLAGCAAKLVTKSACYILFENPNCVGTTSHSELAAAE